MITDESIMGLVHAAGRSLRTLILNNCNQLTDDGVSMIGNRCPDLSTLALSGCTQLVSSFVCLLIFFYRENLFTD